MKQTDYHTSLSDLDLESLSKANLRVVPLPNNTARIYADKTGPWLAVLFLLAGIGLISYGLSIPFPERAEYFDYWDYRIYVGTLGVGTILVYVAISRWYARAYIEVIDGKKTIRLCKRKLFKTKFTTLHVTQSSVNSIIIDRLKDDTIWG